MSLPTSSAAGAPRVPLTVAGGGLVGTLLALYLARRGHQVQVLDRRPDLRRSSRSEGRSINLALSDRGWRALEGVGIADDVRRVSIPLYQRVMHDRLGQLTAQPYGAPGQAIYSVNRDQLNRTMLDLLEARPGVRLRFEQQLQRVELVERTLHLLDVATGRAYTEPYGHLFGTDGAFSAVRGALQRTDRFNYSQTYLEYGYKELTIEAGPGGAWALEKNALHIWPRGQYLMIALPNLVGSFNATLFFPYEGPESFAALPDATAVTTFFADVFPDVVPLMPHLADEFFARPASSLVTVRCYPWRHAADVLLLGDAAHAIVPFYGQGMNAGFEDCTVLDGLLAQHGDDAWPVVMEAFEHQRKPNTDAMADLALYNFVEMRDRVGDPRFLLQKRIENKIAALYPDRWVPLYTRVTFSHLPYADAWAAGQRQDAVMARLMPHIRTEADFDTPAVQAQLHQELTAAAV